MRLPTHSAAVLLAFAFGAGLLTAGTARADEPVEVEPSGTRPTEEDPGESLARQKRDAEGLPQLSYPGRTPTTVNPGPNLGPYSHTTIVGITALSGLTLWAAGSAIAALAFCDDWSQWAAEVFTESRCGVAPILAGSSLLWLATTVAASNFHGPHYDGTRIEAVALVGLGTLVGAGLAGVVWAASDSRALRTAATLLLPIAGGTGFAEIAAHVGTTDARFVARRRSPVGVSASPAGASLSWHVAF